MITNVARKDLYKLITIYYKGISMILIVLLLIFLNKLVKQV